MIKLAYKPQVRAADPDPGFLSSGTLNLELDILIGIRDTANTIEDCRLKIEELRNASVLKKQFDGA